MPRRIRCFSVRVAVPAHLQRTLTSGNLASKPDGSFGFGALVVWGWVRELGLLRVRVLFLVLTRAVVVFVFFFVFIFFVFVLVVVAGVVVGVLERERVLERGRVLLGWA